MSELDPEERHPGNESDTAAGRAHEPVDRLHPVVVHHIVNSLQWPALRPLQQAAVDPLLDGRDALLLAPTAGGKTEAAIFPLLSLMAQEKWQGTSVLYLCPLRALLNNLIDRVQRYAGWLGRSAAVWHGDTTTSQRRHILKNHPDVLLTTPESLESMLVSTNVDHRDFFARLRAVVVDEVHAFAGDDRGWHLLAVLERLTHLAGRPLQRIGLSATVGNPDHLLGWLRGAGVGGRACQVVSPAQESAAAVDITLDFVGTADNAAKVIAALHQGEKRLVFCDSRRLVEEIGNALRAQGVTTFLSHASLSAEERRRSEQAFAEARNCVIVSTSTLELGIDVGDLDRVIQINAPATVAAFLQRLGRAGRRAGATRNCLFLALNANSLLQAAGLLLVWSKGWVEPVIAPPSPRHLSAQQILALCLQEHRVGERLWPQWWNGLDPFGTDSEVVRHLITEGYLSSDDGMLFIGPEAERRFGRRHFMEMTSVFTAPSEFTVITGRADLGRVDPALLSEEVIGPRLLLLGGRSWRVTHIDWSRRRCFVEPTDSGGKARWSGGGVAGLSYQVTRAMRDVLLGTDPPVQLTRRAQRELASVREEKASTADADRTVIRRVNNDVRWWTWAGFRANATLLATIGELAHPSRRFHDSHVSLREDLTYEMWRSGMNDIAEHLRLPHIDERALDGLKFSAALPRHIAIDTLASRLADRDAALRVLAEPISHMTS